MGQKTHPEGFRLVTTQNYLSKWYSSESLYSTLLKEDFFIRQSIEKKLKELVVLSEIQISRTNTEIIEEDLINIKVVALYPRAKDMLKNLLEYFRKTNDLEKRPEINKYMKGRLKDFVVYILKRTVRELIRELQIKTKRIVTIDFDFIRNRFENAALIGKFIAEQLEKRVPFRRAIKQSIKKAQIAGLSGVKIEASGRLNGIDIARSEWKREGKIPLHTLKANIDYSYQRAETIYGTIGIKVWLFSK